MYYKEIMQLLCSLSVSNNADVLQESASLGNSKLLDIGPQNYLDLEIEENFAEAAIEKTTQHSQAISIAL